MSGLMHRIWLASSRHEQAFSEAKAPGVWNCKGLNDRNPMNRHALSRCPMHVRTQLTSCGLPDPSEDDSQGPVAETVQGAGSSQTMESATKLDVGSHVGSLAQQILQAFRSFRLLAKPHLFLVSRREDKRCQALSPCPRLAQCTMCRALRRMQRA